MLGVGDVEERVEGWLRHLRGCKAEKGAAEVCMGALMVGLELLTQECCMQEDEPEQEGQV